MNLAPLRERFNEISLAHNDLRLLAASSLAKGDLLYVHNHADGTQTVKSYKKSGKTLAELFPGVCVSE